MKLYGDNNFDIYYNECDEVYLNQVIIALNESLIEYLNFFKLDKLPSKVKVKFYDKLDDFKMYYEKTRHHPYRNGRVGSAKGNEVHMLSYRERILERPNDTFEAFIMGLKHELVHIVHIAYKGNNDGTWFAEGLANCLGSPRYEETLDGCTLQDFMGHTKYKYNYTVTKYMLENYSHDTILEYAKSDERVIADTEKIFNETKQYLNDRKIK